jgi:DNA invertase Pin-like site-specific DNA recombinase
MALKGMWHMAKKPKERKNVALLYTRVSTQMQVNDGMSLGAQERDLKRAAEMAGFTEMEILREEGRSGKSIKGRPVLREALERLDNGEASAIFVTRIDRLARSTQDFLSIVDRANRNDWRIVMLDLNLDTGSYQGRFVASVMSALAEMERNIIAERQKDVHRDRRENGKVWGVDLGPKPRVPGKIVDRILEERSKGLSYSKIAKRLNTDKIPTVFGKSWYAATIRDIVIREESKKEGQENT